MKLHQVIKCPHNKRNFGEQNLYLRGTKITQLPDNLTCGDLDLRGTPITQLPDNLTCGNLDLRGTPITQLPDNLTCGNLDLSYTKITQLPDNLTCGDLDLRGTQITQLPDNLTCGNLDLSYTKITQLPDNLTCGNLYLRGTQITQLPDNLTCGDLDLRGTPITQLPDNLTCGDLDLRGTQITQSEYRAWFLRHRFTHDGKGWIVYKTFNSQYTAPERWEIRAGSVIGESGINRDPFDSCGAGINVAPLDWVRKHYGRDQIWKCRIRDEWADQVVVPWITDGKVRCEKLEILEEVK